MVSVMSFGEATEGGEPLDSIKGHLTVNPLSPVYVDFDTELEKIPFDLNPYFVPLVGGCVDNNKKKWNRRSEGFDSSIEEPFIAKVQGFDSGGYEVTVYKQDISFLSRMPLLDDDPFKDFKKNRRLDDSVDDYFKDLAGVVDDNNNLDSIQRSKKNIRLRVKSMACDRLLTVTKRESDPDCFWSLEDWKKAWDKFRRLCKKAGILLKYVAVPEEHKKGNYHLHVAIAGHINVKLIRRFWWLCVGGRGLGNVDVSYRQGVSQFKRLSGLARYLSKYITKQLGVTAFNKKRYWASVHSLPTPTYFILNSDNLTDCLLEVSKQLGLVYGAVVSEAYFYGGDGTAKDSKGIWFNFDVHLSEGVPF